LKAFILLDENNIVRCMASEECNLHDDKSHMKKLLVNIGGIVGDKYDSKTKIWTPKPENYPDPNDEDLIKTKMLEIQQNELRQKAIDALVDEGKLSI
jgi:hypothetical protein